MALRIGYSIFLLFSILFLPFWVSAPVALLGLIYFNFYLEAVIIMLISDLLYGVAESRFFEIKLLSTFVAIVLLLFIPVLKRKLKFT